MHRTMHLVAGSFVVAAALLLGTRGDPAVIEAQAPSGVSTTVPATVIATNVPTTVVTTTAGAATTPGFIPARAVTATVAPAAPSTNGGTAGTTPSSTPGFVPAQVVTPTASTACVAAGATTNSAITSAAAGATANATPGFIPARVLNGTSTPSSGTTVPGTSIAGNTIPALSSTPAAAPTFIPAVAASATPSPSNGGASSGTVAGGNATTGAAGTTPAVSPTFIAARAVTATPAATNGAASTAPAVAAAAQATTPLVTSDDGVGVITLDLGNGSTIGPVSIIGFGGGFTFIDESSTARNTALPVVVAKLIDASSPKLLSLALKGQCINSVQVLLCESGNNCTAATAYATYTLSRARISEARIGDDVSAPVLTEQFKITYEQIKLSTPGGAAAPQGDLCFDMTANSAC